MTIVDACRRDAGGGSPTAVLAETDLSDQARCRVPSVMGCSHAVFAAVVDPGPVSLRFFTSAGELPACGHGTVAALAFLAMRANVRRYRAELRGSGRSFCGEAVRHEDVVSASFDPGVVAVRDASRAERELALETLGSDRNVDATGICAASLGRERLLVPIASPAALNALTPDLDRLRKGCDRLGPLGCFVYSAPAWR